MKIENIENINESTFLIIDDAIFSVVYISKNSVCEFYMCKPYDKNDFSRLLKIVKCQSLLGTKYIAFSNIDDIKKLYPELMV